MIGRQIVGCATPFSPTLNNLQLRQNLSLILSKQRHRVAGLTLGPFQKRGRFVLGRIDSLQLLGQVLLPFDPVGQRGQTVVPGHLERHLAVRGDVRDYHCVTGSGRLFLNGPFRHGPVVVRHIFRGVFLAPNHPVQCAEDRPQPRLQKIAVYPRANETLDRCFHGGDDALE